MEYNSEENYTEEYKNLTEYDSYFKEAKEKLKNIENSKQKVIKELAETLEKKGMPLEYICSSISENLAKDGFVTDRYVRDCLDKKYKQKKKIKVAIGGEQQEDNKDKGTAELLPQSKVKKSGNNVTEDSSNDKDNSDNNPDEIVNLTVAGLQKKNKELNQTIENLKKELDSKSKPNPLEEFRTKNGKQTIPEGSIFLSPKQLNKFVIELSRYKQIGLIDGIYITKDGKVIPAT